MCMRVPVCVHAVTHICYTSYIPKPQPHILGLSAEHCDSAPPAFGLFVYLFIYIPSPVLLAGAGEGNYWCGTAGEEANLSLGTSEV